MTWHPSSLERTWSDQVKTAPSQQFTDPVRLETSLECVCPQCLEHFPKKSGKACVDCRCPFCNVPLRSK